MTEESNAPTERQPMSGEDLPVGSNVVGPMWEMLRRLPRYAKAMASMATDDRAPLSAKGILLAGAAYLVSPIDLIPGIIPVAGQLDDIYVVLTSLKLATRSCPANVASEHLQAVGLSTETVDQDLASIREFVSFGLRWAIQRSGSVLAQASQRATRIVQQLQGQEARGNEQKPQQPGSPPASTGA